MSTSLLFKARGQIITISLFGERQTHSSLTVLYLRVDRYILTKDVSL